MVNFRLTKWKGIVSIIISIIAFTVGYWIKNNLIIPFLEPRPQFLSFLLIIIPRLDIYLFIIFLILVYVIWSLIQRK